jgi:hypothetical protein
MKISADLFGSLEIKLSAQPSFENLWNSDSGLLNCGELLYDCTLYSLYKQKRLCLYLPYNAMAFGCFVPRPTFTLILLLYEIRLKWMFCPYF